MSSIISRIIDVRTVAAMQTRDDLKEALAAAMPRRSACRLLGGGALSALLLGRGAAEVAAKCRKKGKKCRRDKQCCSGRCKRKKCRKGRGGPPDPEPEPEPEPEPSDHHVTVSALFRITDDEVFGDEICVNWLSQDATLSPSVPTANIHLEKGCGGEVRVELDLEARLLSNGDVRFSGRAYLYEGVTEHDTDLDGEQRIPAFDVPLGAPTDRLVRIRNQDEGGDFATIDLTITNAVA